MPGVILLFAVCLSYVEPGVPVLTDLLDFNRRVFVYEDDMWAIKGRYETALEDNESALWTYSNGQDVLQLLIVSKICFLFYFKN